MTEEKKKYNYFVSFKFLNRATGGDSNTEWLTDTKISSIKQIREIEERIEEENRNDCVSVSDWQLFDTEETQLGNDDKKFLQEIHDAIDGYYAHNLTDDDMSRLQRIIDGMPDGEI